MDKTILKSFAIESRKDLMEKIDRKIKLFYVDEEFRKDNRGDIIVLSNDKHTLTLTKEEDSNRDKLIRRIVELGYEQVVEEAAYTWFNRIIAIRYMEIHDYLPLTKDNQSLGIRVLSSKDNKLEPEILKFSNLSNLELDISFDRNKYLEYKDNSEKYKYILLLVCKKLGKVIPQVFDGITDYIDILIPDNLLNDQGFINKLLKEVNINYFNQVEIIGWLYQYYISEKKDIAFAELKKTGKIKKENIPSATQIFTPDWIVKYMVENTLGRYADKDFRASLNYFVENQAEIDYKIDIENIKFFDPCCGSGHILVYAFEVLYNMYLNKGYLKNDIPRLIIKNNLFGLDIDERAGQLSVLSVLLKAREYDKYIFNLISEDDINIMSIPDSSYISDSCTSNLVNENNKKKAQYLIKTFNDAKEIGSLLIIDKEDYSNLAKEIENNNTIFSVELRQLLPIIKCANILSEKYEIVVTNPPYMGNRGMDVKLAKYVKDYYSDYKTDLFSAFIKQSYNLVNTNGLYAMITQPTFLFISSFEKVRDDLINQNSIISLLHMGRGIFGIDFGSASFVIRKGYSSDYCGSYFRLNKRTFQYIDIKDIENIFLNAKNNINFKFDFDNYKSEIEDEIQGDYDKGLLRIKYIFNQSNFNRIPGKAFAYWISDDFIKCFDNENLSNYGVACVGLQTSDNKRFLREWFEVDYNKIGFNISNIPESVSSKKKWFPYNKGGDYRKWYGNCSELVNWENDGKEIREYNNYLNSSRSSNIGIANTQYYFHESGTWGLVSSAKFSVRYSPKGAIFDTGGSSLFSSNHLKYLIGLLNTNLVQEIMHIQNPTLNFQPGNVSNIPIILEDEDSIVNIVNDNISISKEDWDSYENSWDFKKHPFLKNSFKKSGRIKEINENWCNECDYKFNKLKSNEENLNKTFIKIYGLDDELSSDVSEKDITIRKSDLVRDIKSLISYAVGCMFGRYSLDEEGIIFAGGKFDKTKYKLFIPDEDNIIPISDDENIYYNDDIVGKFKEFIKVAFGVDYLNENLDYIAEVLGKRGTESSEDTIRRYFVNDFYNDHLKTYQKRPIYWLFDSGKKNGFKCLIYLHRYDEQIVSKIRTKYLHNTIAIYQRNVEEIDYKLNNESLNTTDKRELQSNKVDLNSKITECNEYEEKVGNVANKMIKLDLDDGVAVNYAKFIDDNGKSILAKIK